MKAWTCGQPCAHLGVFVGVIVVHDQMHVQGCGHRPVDALKESEELLMTMARLALGQHCAGSDIKGVKQSGRAVADTVVGHPFDLSKAHRQHRLGAIQGLNLRFFVDRQHDGMIGGFEIQAHHVAHFFHEERIVGEPATRTESASDDWHGL
jgi:hypothetical protein